MVGKDDSIFRELEDLVDSRQKLFGDWEARIRAQKLLHKEKDGSKFV